MSIDFEIRKLVPRFLYNDKNGHALCKAIQAAFEYVAEVTENGIAIIQDVDAMPEWRLDELAWEYNILYDYSADIEVKREWIRNARDFYALYGTPAGVEKYLEAAFPSANVEEAWKYGGDPFHFRVTVTGQWSEESEDWSRKAINTVKNVRSVLDEILYASITLELPLYTGAGIGGINVGDEIWVY